ncbi:PETO1 [Auxenochlorella protothecoides x Auxenochlorella symbiontica]
MRALQIRHFVAPCSSHRTRSRRAPIPSASHGPDVVAKLLQGAKSLASATAAAALLLTLPALPLQPAPADARVILYKPEVRNLATPDPAPAAKSPAAGSATGSNAPAAAPLALPSAEGVDFRVLTLPVVVAALFGGGVAWYILDPGFRLLLKEGALKDSNEYAGYEKELKEGRLPNSRGQYKTTVQTRQMKAGNKG